MRKDVDNRTSTHHTASVPGTHPARLQQALDGAGMTPKMLREALAKNGVDISLQYICDLLSGHRTLKRNPTLRKDIAKAIGVPVDWIEVPRPESMTA